MSNNNKIETNSGIAISKNNGEVHFHEGLSLETIRPYLLEIVNGELNKYKFQALEIAKKRDEEFIISVFNKLNQLDTKIEKIQEALSSPSMQYDLVEAERGYIKTGSKHLLVILGELIAERVNCSNASIKQIVLSEAIKTAPILLDKQLDILALRFLVARTHFPGTISFNQLHSLLFNIMLPFCSKVDSISQLDFEHLDFTRCSIKSITSNPLHDILWENYTSAFYQPFQNAIFNSRKINGKSLFEWYPELFIKTIEGLVSFSVNNYSELINVIDAHKDISDPIRKEMISFYKEHCIEKKQCIDYLFEKAPELKPLEKMWNSGVSSIRLSSIGLAIGAIHAKNVISADINIDLDVWIH